MLAYTDLLFSGIQHNTVVRHIKALLLQIRLAIFTSNNVVGRTAISAISTQLSSSDSLAIPLSSLLKARCAFWHGMFLYSNMDYASALECFKLAAGPLSLVARRSSGSPFTPQSEPLAEGVEEAEKVAKMIWKSELEVGRTPARDAPVMLPAPVTPTRPVINVFTREHEPSLSARYWRPSHAISLSDELSLLDNESDSSNDDDEEDHDSDNESVGTCPSMFEQEPQAHFSSCHTRAGSAASMTSISSSDISLAIRRHARQPSKLNL